MSDQIDGNVAIVALVVSLVALFVTANQFLLQLFNSADGYRRCAETVLDVWHRKRHRKWKWSEFRFETRYTTPQIVLTCPQERGFYDEHHGELYLINGPSLQEGACPELDITVHQDYYHVGAKRQGLSVRSSNHYTKSSTSQGDRDVEKAPIDKLQRSGTRGSVSVRTESDSLVTWLRLLRDLHRLSHSYWPLDCKRCPENMTKRNNTGVAESNFDLLSDKLGDQQCVRTDIAVMYRTWTWDCMPPDIIRPLAEINVGDIIVLAIRMGMQWRHLEPEIGRMQADGNGFSLTSTDVRGLGTVLRFTSAGRYGDFPRIVPSKAADKMLFGIVPGDPTLVRKDLPLVSKDGEIADIARVGELLNFANLGCIPHKNTNVEVFNDLVTLLLPFLPLEGSTITSYCFPVWRIEPYLKGIHFYCESRLALHRRLHDRVKEMTNGEGTLRTLTEVLHHMDILEQRHSHYWYSRWFWNPSIREQETWQDRLAAIQNMRRIFQRTTDYFVEKGFDQEHIDGSSKYLHLVVANAFMSNHAIEDVNASEKKHPQVRKHEAQRKAYNITSRHGYFFGSRHYDMAQRYVDYMPHADFGVAAHLRERNVCLEANEVEAAWWVLQLRGIVWSISTWHPNDVVQKILGNPVPSSYYGNRTPVWVT